MDNSFKLIALRGLSLLLSLQGQSKAATALNRIIDAIEAGMEVDNYMASVAEAFKSGQERDWDDIIADVTSQVSEFLADDPAPTVVDTVEPVSDDDDDEDPPPE